MGGSDGFWPWWLGALCLSGLVVGFFFLTRRPLGVSGSLARMVNLREEQACARAEGQLCGDPVAFEAALLAATAEQFKAAIPETGAQEGEASRDPLPIQARPPWSASLTFLMMLIVGGFLGSLFTGRFKLQDTLGAAYEHLVAGGWRIWPIVFVGGLLVGFGTRMAGGCSAGHGLSGCSRLQPGSLVATMSFFGIAILTSFLLG